MGHASIGCERMHSSPKMRISWATTIEADVASSRPLSDGHVFEFVATFEDSGTACQDSWPRFESYGRPSLQSYTKAKFEIIKTTISQAFPKINRQI